MRFMVEEQSRAVFNSSIVTEVLMSSQTLSTPDSLVSRMPGFAFRSAFTVCAVAAPMLLVAYAFAIFPDAMDRANFVLQGLESIAFALVAALIVAAYYGFAAKSDPRHLIAESNAASFSTPA